MMLGAKQISKDFNNGGIVIEPFNKAQLGPNSYDVRLGNWFARNKHTPVTIDLCTSSHTIEMVNALWSQPHKLLGDQVLVLEPYEYILAHTHEIVGSYKYTTLLKARSTIARVGIDICASAGFGDVGFVNYWTLEIKNNTSNHIILRPGMRIAQIAFIQVKGVGHLYKGVYMNKAGDWHPYDMLPKIGRDRMF